MSADADARDQIKRELSGEATRSALEAKHMGLAIVCFSLPLLAGTVLGSLARIHLWLVEEPRIPWGMEANERPAFAVTGKAGMLDALVLAADLRALGYSDESIEQLVGQFAALGDGAQSSPTIPWDLTDDGFEPNDVHELGESLGLALALRSQGYTEKDISTIMRLFHELDEMAEAAHAVTPRSAELLRRESREPGATLPTEDPREDQPDVRPGLELIVPDQRPAGWNSQEGLSGWLGTRAVGGVPVAQDQMNMEFRRPPSF